MMKSRTKKRSRYLSLVLTIVLGLAFVLSGCGNTSNDSGNDTSASVASQAQTSGQSKLDPVKLHIILYGEQPKDGARVMEEVNKKLQADINATVEIEYIPYADIATKTPLRLADPSSWDIVLSTPVYAANATKGAFREITMDDVQKYMPLSYEATTEDMWGDAKIDGKIYMIPQTFKEIGIGAQFYREDLREKYNVPEIKKTADFEAYFKAIKENETGMLPVDGTASDVMALFGSFMIDSGYYNKLGGLIYYSPDDPTNQIKTIFDPDFVNLYKQAAVNMKRFYDEGLLPKNPYSQKTAIQDLAAAGKSSYWTNAFENYPQYEAETQAKGWKLGALPGWTSTGANLIRPATGNGYSFSPASRNYERALMAIDLFNQNKDYDMLLSFGIEGVNYVISNGKLELGPEIDATNNPYPMYAHGFWACNRDLWPPLQNYSENYLSLKQQILSKAVNYPLYSFNPNNDPVKTEFASINNVYQQYGTAIEIGMTPDVDAAIKELQDKMKVAGADKLIAEYKTQLQKYLDGRK